MEQLIFPITKREAEKQGIPYSSRTNKDALFPSRLRALRNEKGVSQLELSKVLGVSKSTVGLWETGDTLPDAESLYYIARYFHVSSDYILGLSPVKSSDQKVAEICKYTGLSQNAVTILYVESMEYSKSFVATLVDNIISDAAIGKAQSFLERSKYAALKLSQTDTDDIHFNTKMLVDALHPSEEHFEGMIRIPAADAIMVYKDRVCSDVMEVCKHTIDSWLQEGIELLEAHDGVEISFQETEGGDTK